MNVRRQHLLHVFVLEFSAVARIMEMRHKVAKHMNSVYTIAKLLSYLNIILAGTALSGGYSAFPLAIH